MKNTKSKDELLAELAEMRQRLAELEGGTFDAEKGRKETGFRGDGANFRAIVENSTQGILVYRGTKLLFVNKGIANILGYEQPDEMLKMDSMIQLAASYEVERLGNYYQAREKGLLAPDQCEYDALHRDGSIIALHQADTVIRWGDQPAIFSIITDITDRKQAERELRESAERGKRQRNAIVKLTLDDEHTSADLKHSYEKVCEILSETISVARASIWELSEDGQELRCLDLFERGSDVHSAGQILNARDIPKYFNAIKTESRIYAEDVQNDPRTNELTEGYLKPLGITSMLDAGIVIEGKLVGVVCCEHIGEMRKWHPDEESFVSTVAAFVAQLIVEEERDRAEETLRNSEAHLRTLIETIPDLVWLKDLDGVYLSCNPEFVRFSVPRGAEIIGKTDYDFFSKEEADAFRQNDLDVMESKQASLYEELATTIDGEQTKVFETIKTPMLNEKDEIVGVLGIARDITGRKKIEEKIQRQADRAKALASLSNLLTQAGHDYQLMLDTVVYNCAELIGDGASVFLYSPENEFLEVAAVYNRDPAAIEIFKKEFSARPIHVSEGTYAKVIEEKRPVLVEAVPLESLVNNPEYERRDYMRLLPLYSMMLAPLRVQGRILGIIGMGRHAPGKNYTSSDLIFLQDIADRSALAMLNAQIYHELQQELNERKLAEQALSFSEKKFSGAFHSSPVMMTLEDEDHRLVDANQAFCDALGYSREEVLGRTVADLNLWVEPDDANMVRKLAQEQKGLKNVEIPFRRRSGEIGVALTSSEKFETNNVIYELSSGLDITERKQMEDRLFEEKELAQVTLHSIGDAVITTNVDAQIEYLNPIAEKLTGWKTEDAFGRNLAEVFHVISEETRQPVIDPVKRCLQEDRVVGLANHSILIGRDGQEYSINDSAAPIRNRQGKSIGAVLVFHDISEERRLSLQVAHDAKHDSLTGLVNRREFEKRLERALKSAKERNVSHILCYLDMDQFKIVNDTAGHAAGDEMLKQISGLLSDSFRQRDTVARLGGDEFGLLVENCQLDDAMAICDKILTEINQFLFVWDDNRFHIGASIGVVPITPDKENIGQLLSQADIACYAAKDLGRNRVCVYEVEDAETIQRHSAILQAARMRDAITRNQFQLYCQPIAFLADEYPNFRIYEVLLRMVNDENELVPPSVFIPPAERYGLMQDIDQWVVRQTFSVMSSHNIGTMQVAINLSGNSLDDENFLKYVAQQFDEFSIHPNQICFEITETAAIQHLNKAQKFIQNFRERGGKIALDDFGSGFSSFRYLQSLPVDYIKIDGAFVSEMLSNPGHQAMVEAITSLAHTLGIHVIAEHATNQATVDRLREIGVEGIQGYGIGYPTPVDVAWKAR